MKILYIISITFLIVFAVGCDEMQSQVMKPMTMPDDGGPTEDEVVTSVGTMKDPSMTTDDSKEEEPPETETMEEGTSTEPETMEEGTSTEPETMEEGTSTEPETMEEDTSGETQTMEEDTSGETQTTEEDTSGEPETPVATFSSASPASGDISENETITITFDNDPGEVTVNTGTVSGSGTSWTISGPFSEGSLALTISWTNGDGSKTLAYNVEADESQQIPDAVFSSASPESGNISESGSITINFDNDPGEVTVNTGTVSGSGTSRTISGPFTEGSLTLTISWTNGNGSKTLNYNVEADVAFSSASPESGDISENETITINFDNDPGEVTVSEGTVSGSGTSWTINGPFSVGSLTLTISWTNGNGSHMLSYNVEADEPQIPDATFSSASPASGDISENDSITIIFDNDPGEVTVNTGTVSGSGTTRTISGPFSVGSLTLTISWTNGNGSKTLNYNVVDSTPPEVSTSSTADGAVDVDPTTVSNSGITVTFNEPITIVELKLYKDNVDVGWTATNSGISGNTITITKGSGQELSHDTMYKIKGTVKDSANNENAVSITFTTKSAPVQLEPLARGEGLRIGVTAPTFSVNDSDGNTYSFDGNSGGSTNIVILFYRGWW